ncbi:hypothetical protein QA612_20965 [Evansella sp. AB-P1]|uniref:hypothetical protein n=1 Tax=Evansella sp. AB-P1 TaxID=3037653 RepID=UPI00241E01B4|nr:hypothetical protein [Evansella sp. AB-P1]MDG5789932.1 hypothetical protein [Evansella sp. AB-P1]
MFFLKYTTFPQFQSNTVCGKNIGFIHPAFVIFHRLREEYRLHSSRIYVFPPFAGMEDENYFYPV